MMTRLYALCASRRPRRITQIRSLLFVPEIEHFRLYGFRFELVDTCVFRVFWFILLRAEKDDAVGWDGGGIGKGEGLVEGGDEGGTDEYE